MIRIILGANPLFTPIKPVICTGFAVRADGGVILLVPMVIFFGGGPLDTD